MSMTPGQAMAELLPYPCLWCDALPGEPCRKADGSPAVWPHGVRRDLAAVHAGEQHHYVAPAALRRFHAAGYFAADTS